MVDGTILFPSFFSGVPAQEPGRRLTVASILMLLEDIAENSLIFVDRDNVIFRELSAQLDSWPADYRTRAQKLLEFIAKKNRFVRIKTGYPRIKSCCNACREACSLLAHMRESHSHVMGFVPATCKACVAQISPPLNICELSEYPLSEFFRKRRSARAITLKDGQWSSDDLADRFIRPLLAYANILKIYDRLIVRSMWTGSDKALPGSQLELLLSPNFDRTLAWLFEILGANKRRFPIEIYSTLDSGSMDNTHLQLAKNVLEKLCSDAKKKYNLSVAVFAKKETPFEGMPHGRYIVTDQFAFLVERGFDLLWDDAKMQKASLNIATTKRRVRDVSISLCEDASSVELMTSRLRAAL
jgi:hypothetical protein